MSVFFIFLPYFLFVLFTANSNRLVIVTDYLKLKHNVTSCAAAVAQEEEQSPSEGQWFNSDFPGPQVEW